MACSRSGKTRMRTSSTLYGSPGSCPTAAEAERGAGPSARRRTAASWGSVTQLLDDARPVATHDVDRWFEVVHRLVQPLRDGVASGCLDLVEAVHLHDPPRPVAGSGTFVLLEDAGVQLEAGGDVHLLAVAPHLEVVEGLGRLGFLDDDVTDAVAAERLQDTLVDGDRRLLGPCRRRVEEADGAALLDALGQVLTLAVGLPAPERCEGAVGDVSLRLAVADEAHVRRAGHTAAERLGSWSSRGEVVANANDSVRPRGAVLVELGQRPVGRSGAGAGHEARLVRIGIRLGEGRSPPVLVADQVQRVRRHVTSRCAASVPPLPSCGSSRRTRRRGSRNRRAPCRTDPPSR